MNTVRVDRVNETIYAVNMKKKPSTIFKEGQNAYFKTKGMLVEVLVLKVGQSYGRTRYKVAPLTGKGSAIIENLTKI